MNICKREYSIHHSLLCVIFLNEANKEHYFIWYIVHILSVFNGSKTPIVRSKEI